MLQHRLKTKRILILCVIEIIIVIVNNKGFFKKIILMFVSGTNKSLQKSEPAIYFTKLPSPPQQKVNSLNLFLIKISLS